MREYIINIIFSFLSFCLSFLIIRFVSYRRSLKTDNPEKLFIKPTVKQTVYFLISLIILIVTGILLIYFYVDNSVLFNLARLFVLSVLIGAAFFDLKSYIIPNELIILALIGRAVFLGAELVFSNEGLLREVIEQLITAAVLVIGGLICSLVLKNGIGMGDVKLFAIIGLFFGAMGSLTAIFLSLLVSFVISIVLLISKKKKKNEAIPFAPCVLIGTFVAIVIFGV